MVLSGNMVIRCHFKCVMEHEFLWKACCKILSSLRTTRGSDSEVVFSDCKRSYMTLLWVFVQSNPTHCGERQWARAKNIMTFPVQNCLVPGYSKSQKSGFTLNLTSKKVFPGHFFRLHLFYTSKIFFFAKMLASSHVQKSV